MTNNHLILNRLTELMLEQQNHRLTVDEIFEDEQIGDFVRSIQIDSPYQQLLLEGVLTESVWDGKVSVNFTVEGYFHFILGQIISKLSEEDSKTPLILIHSNKLIGLKAGFTEYLLRVVENNNLTLLVKYINEGLEKEMYGKALAKAFLLAILNFKKESTESAKRVNAVRLLLNELSFLQPNHFIQVLQNVIQVLDNIQHLEFKEIIYREYFNYLPPEIRSSLFSYPEQVCFRIETLTIFNDDQAKENVRVLEDQLNTINDRKSLGTVLIELGEFNSRHLQFNKARDYFKEAEKILLPPSPGYFDYKLSLIDLNDEKPDEAFIKSNNALKIQIKTLGPDNLTVARSYYLLSRILETQNNIKDSYKFMRLCCELKEKLLGSYHDETAVALQGLGNLLKSLNRFDDALFNLNKSLKIRLRIFGENEPIIADLKSDIAGVLIELNRYQEALKLCHESHAVFLSELGQDNVFTETVLEMIEEIKEKLKGNSW